MNAVNQYRLTWSERMIRSFFVLAASCAAMISASAFAKDGVEQLRTLLPSYQTIAKAYEVETAKRKVGHVGTAFNEFGLKKFMCASLALVLGKTKIFNQLTEIETPQLTANLTEGEIVALGLSSRLFNNRVSAVETVLSMSARDRVEHWNLDCVRQHGISMEHSIPRIKAQATFDIRSNDLFILGDIKAGFFEELRRILEQNKQIKRVVLGSGGGSIRDAILTGLLIRKKKLNTTLNADCYSACPLIFLGGVERVIYSPYRRLGFHQVSVDGRALPLNHKVYKLIRQYVQKMGANERYLLTLMHRSKPNQMSYPQVWDLCKPGITTWVQRGC